MIAPSSLAIFTDLYRKYSASVYRYALGLSGNTAEAEDVTSEAFLRIWRSPAPVRLETARAYLVAVARNVYLENLRKRKREAPLDFVAPAPDNPGAEYEWREELRRLRRLMAGLPEITRSALIMHAVLEMSYAEIEAVLGLPVAALKVRLHRARIRLAAQLAGQEVSK